MSIEAAEKTSQHSVFLPLSKGGGDQNFENFKKGKGPKKNLVGGRGGEIFKNKEGGNQTI